LSYTLQRATGCIVVLNIARSCISRALHPLCPVNNSYAIVISSALHCTVWVKYFWYFRIGVRMGNTSTSILTSLLLFSSSMFLYIRSLVSLLRSIRVYIDRDELMWVTFVFVNVVAHTVRCKIFVNNFLFLWNVYWLKDVSNKVETLVCIIELTGLNLLSYTDHYELCLWCISVPTRNSWNSIQISQ
jgi:hypothetical protein